MPLIPFPNVPKLPGVPQLIRSPNFPAAPPRIVSAIVAVGRLWQALFSQPKWAIYKQQPPQPSVDANGVETITVVADRKPVVVPDTFLAFNYRNESSLSSYPVQNGGFMNYDKVANPFESMVRMSKGGSDSERKKFIDSIDAIIDTLDLYDILTPEKTYLGVNVTRLEIAREGNRGAAFFSEVNLYFQEIREVTAVYSTTSTATENAKDPSARPVQNNGAIQGQTTTATPESVAIPPKGL
jgi:hypothetical protein